MLAKRRVGQSQGRVTCCFWFYPALAVGPWTSTLSSLRQDSLYEIDVIRQPPSWGSPVKAPGVWFLARGEA